MSDLTLYSMPSSGNSYKVRLLLAHLGRPYTHVPLEADGRELAAAKAEGRLPTGRLPVLELACGTRLAESNAILCYLAEGTDWWPDDALARARALSWMFFEQNSHEPVIAVRIALAVYPSRAHLATPERLADLADRGHAALAILDDALTGADWLAGPRPTVADLALYGYTHRAGPVGGYDMARFPAVMDWLARVAALPGHVTLEAIP